MSTIGATMVQYVRCIKPNPVKSKDVFSMQMVVEQLRCAGVIEAIRISRAGFPNKVAHQEFLDRFAVLSPQSAPSGNPFASSPSVAATFHIMFLLPLPLLQRLRLRHLHRRARC